MARLKSPKKSHTLFSLAEDIQLGKKIAISMNLDEIIEEVAKENGINSSELEWILFSDYSEIIEECYKEPEIVKEEKVVYRNRPVQRTYNRPVRRKSLGCWFVILFGLAIGTCCCWLPYVIGGRV